MANKPPRINPKVVSAPKIKQVYWADFPQDAQLPEFWKKRPVVIISPRCNLYGCVTVVPLSSKSQPENKNAHAFQSVTHDEGLSWAICNHILTLAVSRLTPMDKKIIRVDEADFNEIIKLVHKNIPKPR